MTAFRAPHRGMLGESPGTQAREVRPPGADDPDVLFVGLVGGAGGASMLMLELADRMIARGVGVRIVVPDWPATEAYASRARGRGVPVVRTSGLRYDKPKLPAALAALGLVRRCRAPVIHYHSSENTLDHRLLWAMRVLRAPPALVTLHSPYDRPAPGTPAAQHWARAAARRFSRVVCISRGSQERQLAYGVPRELTELIPNGVDLARYRAGDGLAARRVLGLDAAAPLVTVIARLQGQKRPLDAVAAFARVAGRVPDAHLAFVGEGPLEEELRAAAAQCGLAHRIHLVGQRADVADWLAATTVWMLPTESEGLSLGVIEAMAAGCAILSTDCPGNDELLVDGVNGCLTPVGDVPALAARLERLLGDPALRQRLGAAARESSAAYSLERAVDAHLSCYAAVGGLAGRPAAAGSVPDEYRQRVTA